MTLIRSLEFALLEEDIAERSDGNPGAITVMCVGVIHHGREFYLGIERAGFRGSEIYKQYKDVHDCDLERMFESLKAVPS